jgi:hypothetical protein
MPDETAQDRRISDELAAFTDQVLARQADGEPQLAPEHEDLRQLQETVLRLKRVRTASQPSPDFANRLRALLNQEWQRNGANRQPASLPRASFLQKVRRFFEQSRPRMLVLQFAAITVVLLVVALFVTPLSGGAPLTGAAGVDAVIKPVVLVLGLLLVLLVIWLARPKGR